MTDDRIREMRVRYVEAGDQKMVAICDIALLPDDDSTSRVARWRARSTLARRAEGTS